MNNLTIIIPVYNREKTIKRPLDSIIPSLDRITELMVINDGSTDNAEEIIKEYKEKYGEKITYYFKENEGIASTRNFGITHAKGDYIMFVDSDDYIDKDLIEKLEKYINEDADVIKFKLNKVNENGEVLEKIDGPVFEKIDGQAGFNKLVFSDILIDTPCIYVFKKELFMKNDLYFKKGTEHEDFGLMPLVLASSKSIISTNIYGYNYVQEQDSIIRNSDYKKTIKKMQDMIKHYDYMIEYINKKDLNLITKKNLKTYYTNAVILKLKELKKEDQKDFISQIRKRNMISNIQVKNIKQLIKKLILSINTNWYLKLK